MGADNTVLKTALVISLASSAPAFSEGTRSTVDGVQETATQISEKTVADKSLLQEQIELSRKGKGLREEIQIAANLLQEPQGFQTVALDNPLSLTENTNERTQPFNKINNIQKELEENGSADFLRSAANFVYLSKPEEGEEIDKEQLQKDVEGKLIPRLIKYTHNVTRYGGDNSEEKRVNTLANVKSYLEDFLDDNYLLIDSGLLNGVMATFPGTIVLATADELKVSHLNYSVTVADMEASLEAFLKSGDSKGVHPELQKYLAEFRLIAENEKKIAKLDKKGEELDKKGEKLNKSIKRKQDLIDRINKLMGTSKKA